MRQCGQGATRVQSGQRTGLRKSSVKCGNLGINRALENHREERCSKRTGDALDYIEGARRTRNVFSCHDLVPNCHRRCDGCAQSCLNGKQCHGQVPVRAIRRDLGVGACSEEPETALAQLVKAMAQAVIDLFVDRLKTGRDEPRHPVFEFELKIRASSRPR